MRNPLRRYMSIPVELVPIVPVPEGLEYCQVCCEDRRFAVFGEGVLSWNLCQWCGQSADENQETA